MNKIRVSAVSYVNTFPFLYGIEKKIDDLPIDIVTDVPSECARKLIDNEVDLGLIPVAAIPDLKNAEIISDFCIGSIGEVKSVLLVSQKPIEEIEKVYLDKDSRSSVNLFKVLAKHHWKRDFETEQLDRKADISELESAVLIGDKTFNLKGYNYVYDLSEEWYKLTKLPFVFAIWASNKKLPQEFIDKFNMALSYGVSRIEECLNFYKPNALPIEFYYDYLNNDIDFNLDADKRKAMNLFLSYL